MEFNSAHLPSKVELLEQDMNIQQMAKIVTKFSAVIGQMVTSRRSATEIEERVKEIIRLAQYDILSRIKTTEAESLRHRYIEYLKLKENL